MVRKIDYEQWKHRDELEKKVNDERKIEHVIPLQQHTCTCTCLLDQWDVHKDSQTRAALADHGSVRSLIVRLPRGVRVEQNPCRACGETAYRELETVNTIARIDWHAILAQ